MTLKIVMLPGTLTFFILNPNSFHLSEVFHQFPCHVWYLSKAVGPSSPTTLLGPVAFPGLVGSAQHVQRPALSPLPAREEALPPAPLDKEYFGVCPHFFIHRPFPFWQLRHSLGNRRVMECLNSFSFYGEPLPYSLHPSSPRAGLFLTFPGLFIILPQALTTCSLQKTLLTLVACGEARAEGHPPCQGETCWQSNPRGCCPPSWQCPMSLGSLIPQRDEHHFGTREGHTASPARHQQHFTCFSVLWYKLLLI